MFPKNFIDSIILKGGSVEVMTRFPPEPSGYLHLGHVKSIALNFYLAKKYGGRCNLRMDDTNPVTSKQEFVDKIISDVAWLGFTPHQILYTSDYFPEMYLYAEQLIRQEDAYVCDLTIADVNSYRGTLTTPGKQSPFRNRSVEENLDLFDKMKLGLFADGSRTLRAKISMDHGNINLRDPVLMRIKGSHLHYRHGSKYSLYPSYDFSHTISDALERITHSICTLEFQDHRALYEWILDKCQLDCRPKQVEIARLEVRGMITAKRMIRKLMDEDSSISSLNDPRLDTISGLRTRGYHPQALLNFCYETGVSKQNSIMEKSLVESHQRLFLDSIAERKFIVIHPLQLEVTDADDIVVHCANHPKLDMGERQVSASNLFYIEKDDFTLDLKPGQKKIELHGTVALLKCGLIKCTGYDLDPITGEVVKIYARKAGISERYSAVISWVNLKDCHHLCLQEVVGGKVASYRAVAEKSFAHCTIGQYVQAYRLGYIKVVDTPQLIARLKR